MAIIKKIAIMRFDEDMENKDMEKLEPSYIAGRDLKWCSCFGKYSGSTSKGTELPYDPAILLLGIYTREIRTYVHIQTSAGMFIASYYY